MTERMQLENTRGVPLRNLAILCRTLASRDSHARWRDLARLARRLGLEDFSGVGKTGIIPTRVRHYDYALQKLELVEVSKDYFDLTNKGQKLAHLAERTKLEPIEDYPDRVDRALPPVLQSEFREILCSSRYVRYWWLRYFMPRDEFSLNELMSQGKDVIIELVPSDERGVLSTDAGRRSNDTGYRIHSYFHERKTLYLDGAKRREIYSGLRAWSLRVQLIDEIMEWMDLADIEPEFTETLESSNSSASRVYVVKKHWGMDTPIEQFENMLTKLRREMGGVQRFHIPKLTMLLRLKHGLSKQSVQELLQRLYLERSAKYFFESASKHLLTRPGNPFPLESYIKIAGTWRTSLVFKP